SDRIWPLFTLWKDSTHYIEFLADCENSRCLVRIRNGSGAVSQVPFAPGNFWLPDAPLFVAFSYNSTSHALTLAASLGCGQVQTYTVAAFVPGSAYDALKFRGAIGGYSNDGEVCELRVFGGQIDTASGVDVSAAFADLAFLL
ncbi:MAG: hypothetical protein IT437_02890, partial [Phycisphaerales bacterium]|nr:hypothetical protein [Phycisphaerales bacterium]